ncbi:hypothetical protein [Streptomyces sp. NPDC004270]
MLAVAHHRIERVGAIDLGDDDRRQSSAGNNGIVINGGTAHVGNQAVGASSHIQQVVPVSSYRPDPNGLQEVIWRLQQMVEMHRWELAEPELVVEMLHRMHEEIEQPDPSPNLLRSLSARLYVLIQQVPPLVMVVQELERTVRDMFENAAAGTDRSQAPAARSSEPEPASVPVTIYLSDEAPHADVQTAVETLLATAGLEVLDREDPILGSWFRRMRATISSAARSRAVREGALTAAHIADARLLLPLDATNTATMMQNVGPLLTALQPTKDAVVRIGAILVVKVDWQVHVLQLTAAQQATLDHRPQLATSPRDVISAIGLLSASSSPTAADSNARTAADR